jgi:hypothetical protein
MCTSTIEKIITLIDPENSDSDSDSEKINQDVYFNNESTVKNFRGNSDLFFEKMYDNLFYFFKMCNIIYNLSKIYLLWIFLHYFASHLYVKLCVPNTIIGFIMSTIMTATPHCQGLRWLIYNGANVINNMWVICGTYICSNILKLNIIKDI